MPLYLRVIAVSAVVLSAAGAGAAHGCRGNGDDNPCVSVAFAAPEKPAPCPDRRQRIHIDGHSVVCRCKGDW
jgi:hypothetical protein